MFWKMLERSTERNNVTDFLRRSLTTRMSFRLIGVAERARENN